MRRLRALIGLDEPQETKFFLVIAAWGLGIGIVYWFVSYEPAGTVLLVGLGVACGLVAARLVVLDRGTVRRRSQRAAELPVAGVESSEPGTGGVDRPFAAHGRIPDPTVAPFAVGLGAAVMATGAIFGVAPVALGIVPLVWGALMWLAGASDELEATSERDAVGAAEPVGTTRAPERDPPRRPPAAD